MGCHFRDHLGRLSWHKSGFKVRFPASREQFNQLRPSAAAAAAVLFSLSLFSLLFS